MKTQPSELNIYISKSVPVSSSSEDAEKGQIYIICEEVDYYNNLESNFSISIKNK